MTIQEAPARFWYISKDGTPVKKYDTAGETLVDVPDWAETATCDDMDELAAVEVDLSVLSQKERFEIGVF